MDKENKGLQGVFLGIDEITADGQCLHTDKMPDNDRIQNVAFLSSGEYKSKSWERIKKMKNTKDKAKERLRQYSTECYIHMDANTEDAFVDGYLDGAKDMEKELTEKAIELLDNFVKPNWVSEDARQWQLAYFRKQLEEKL